MSRKPPYLSVPQVWVCPLNSNSWCPEEAESWLDEQERRRHEAFGHPVAARRFLLARAIVKSTVACLEGVSPPAVRLAYSDNGKPYLPGDQRPCFSISHCAEAVVVAFAPFSIGVDLETVQRPRQPWKRPGMFLSVSEAERITNLPVAQQPQRFAVCWTCQEAAVKLLDASIFSADSRIVFTGEGRCGECSGNWVHFLSWLISPQSGRAVAVEQSVSQGEGLVLSLAAMKPVGEVSFHRWSAP